jgi:hypothetical protein
MTLDEIKHVLHCGSIPSGVIGLGIRPGRQGGDKYGAEQRGRENPQPGKRGLAASERKGGIYFTHKLILDNFLILCKLNTVRVFKKEG